MMYGFIGIGFLLFLLGGEALLRGSVGLSKALGVAPIYVGIIVVSLTMAAPELSVVLQATARHLPDIALGDIVGSTIVNILLVFGLGGLLRPMPGSPRVVFRDGSVMIAAAIIVVIVMLTGYVSRIAGAVLLVLWIGYLALALVTDWRRPPQLSPAEARARARDEDSGGGIGIFLFIFGIVCLFFGARFVIDAGVAIARDYHVPRLFVALLLVSLGTSLPELAITLMASMRGHTSVASGQLIASNIFGLLFVLGIAAILHPFPASSILASIDGPIMIGAAMVLVAFLLSGWRLTRGQGLMLFAGYVVYVVFALWRSGLLTHG